MHYGTGCVKLTGFFIGEVGKMFDQM